MKRWIATALLFAAVLTAQAEETYRTVNPDGSVEFSDTPSETAEPVDIPKPQTYNPSSYALPRSSGAGSEAGPDSAPSYAGFIITSPANDSNFHSGDGSVSVNVKMPDGADEGLVVVVRLDGSEVARGPGPAFTLSNVDRGSHRLVAQLLNDSGAVLATTPAITFHLQRPSLLRQRPGN